MIFRVSYDNVDQGIAGNGNSVKDLVDSIGTTKQATLLFTHSRTCITRETYIFLTAEIIPDNINVQVEKGAILSIGTGVTLTINGPFESPLSQVFSGAGSVVLGDLIPSAYPEWWGIDGTADDVQINAALDAADSVILQGTRYYIALPLYPNDNNLLIGKGRDVTYLDWSGAVTDNGKIEILDKDNVTLKGFTIDCQTADGVDTIGNSSGILVDDGPTNIEIDNVHVFDAGKAGIIITTGSEISLSRIKVSSGCTSNAIFIGQWPEVYGLAVNKDCTDITLDDILIENVLLDGIGIWNCSGGDAYASVCERINTSNLIVKTWGRAAGLGYAYWLSGVITYVTDVNLNNFAFDNSTWASYAPGDGRGLHIEDGQRINHSNGTIVNLRKGDGSLTSGGYGITIAGGSNINYSNIIIEDTTIGVNSAATTATDVNLDNIFVSGSAYGSFYGGGTRFKLTNCTAYQLLGLTGSGFQLISTGGTLVDFILDDCTAIVTHATDPTYGISILGTGTMENVTLGKLDITADHGVSVAAYTHRPNVHGNKQTVKLQTATAAGTDYEVPIILSGTGKGGRVSIISANLSFAAAIAQDVTDNNTYTLTKYNAAGGGAAALGTAFNTNTADFTTALVPVPFYIDTTAEALKANLGLGEILTLIKTHANAGKAETEGVLTIEYVSY